MKNHSNKKLNRSRGEIKNAYNLRSDLQILISDIENLLVQSPPTEL